MIYSIVSNEQVPGTINELFQALAYQMAIRRATLRTSYTASDRWQRLGAEKAGGSVEVYVPWKHASELPHTLLIPQKLATATAQRYLAGFRHLKQPAKLTIATSVCVILGHDLKHPSEVLFTYYKGKPCCQNINIALKLANAYNVRVYNLANDEHLAKIRLWIDR